MFDDFDDDDIGQHTIVPDQLDDSMMYDDVELPGSAHVKFEPAVNIKEEPMDHDLGNLPLPPELANQGNGVKGKSFTIKKEGLNWLVVVAGKPVKSFFT